MAEAAVDDATAPAPGPLAAELGRGRRYAAFGAVILTTLLAALDQTVVATALPRIVGDLRGFEHLSWVVTAYLIASTITIPIFGRLSDQYGRRRMFLIAIAIFLVGSALCGAAQSMAQLTACRAIQGLGAGGLLPLGSAVIADLFPPRERGRYLGVITAGWAVAGVAGPLVGGVLTDHASWRWVFLVNLPLCVIAAAVLLVALPPLAHGRRHRLDYPGVALIGCGVTGVLLAASWAGTSHSWTSPAVLVAGLGGLALVVAFVLWERRAAEPLVPMGLFADRTFAVAFAGMFIVGAIAFGLTIYVPLYVQGVQGESATSSGIVLLPFVFGWSIVGVLVGQLVARRGRYRRYPIAGSAIVLAALSGLALIEIDTGPMPLRICLAAAGAGMGMIGTVYVLAVQNAVDRADVGIATSALIFSDTIGAAITVAGLGALLTSRLDAELAGVAGAPAVQDLLHGGAASTALDPATTTALFASLSDVYLAMVPLPAIGLVLALLLRELPLRRA